MSRFWIAGGILSLGLMATVNAQASNVLPTTNTATPVTFSFGTGPNTWSVAIFSCNEMSNGTMVTGDCSNEQVTGVVTGGSLALTYQSLSGSSLLNTTVGTGANKEMAFSETVTAPGGKLISAVTLGLTGTTTSGGAELLAVKTSETDNTPGQLIALNTNMSNGSSPYSVSQSIATPANALTITKDMGASNLPGTSGDLVALNTVTQTFSVPEPASISLLGMALGGLLGLRRRRGRPTA